MLGRHRARLKAWYDHGHPAAVHEKG
jgi:hypothetical protein